VLCVLLTAWFDEFVNSKAAICVALRVPTERVCAVSNVPFRRRQRRSGTSSFVYFLECSFDLEFNSGKLAV